MRGLSDFGFSYVYVIFEDGTDLYWARSRVLEALSKIQGALPAGVKTEIGPDASGVGWVYQYALVDRSGKTSLDELRSLQDWFLRYAIQSTPGVAEVATVGGPGKQFQVSVDPNKLAAYRVSIEAVAEAVEGRQRPRSAGACVEISGREYMVRGRGYVKDHPGPGAGGAARRRTARRCALGRGHGRGLGPEMRRGLTDLDGQGDVVGGIVVMRQGENALDVIERVKREAQGAEAGPARRRRRWSRPTTAPS